MASKLWRVALTVVIASALLSVFVVFTLRSGPVTITPLMVKNPGKFTTTPQKRWVPIDSISPEMIKAVISTEDNNFFYHKGFDVDAIMQALKRNERGRKTYGASTISQQTAKNVFLPPSRTWIRKGFEAGFTILIEAMWTKSRIMEVYLNVIEMGKNIYGVEGAAQSYFRKPARKLSRGESALIAIALPSPRRFNPARPSGYMISRQAHVYNTISNLPESDWCKHIKHLKEVKINYVEK